MPQRATKEPLVTFTPVAPSRRVEPKQIAADTWLVHQVQDALAAPLSVYLNSMVITGAEPVIVDTGTIANREQWLADTFSIVAPEDVRWVFLSHEDIDHIGNLGEVMTRCTNATLVCSWTIAERASNAFAFPLERCRWINDGDSFDAGDRTFRALRPPVYDSPTTRGLFDERTGVYWGVDAFATPMPLGHLDTVAELEPELWADGMAMFVHNALSPWLGIVDPAKFRASCDAVQGLGMRTIATAHSPLITEETIAEAFALLRELPAIPAPPVPDQVALDAILSGVC
jgi:flavorubredoxin